MRAGGGGAEGGGRGEEENETQRQNEIHKTGNTDIFILNKYE